MYLGYWAQQNPEKPAVTDAESGESLSFAVLNQRSNQLSRLLTDRGFEAGARVAVYMENNLRYFEIIWAAMRSGIQITPVNRYLTVDEVAYILRDSKANALVTSVAMAEVSSRLVGLVEACELWLMVGGTCPGYESYEQALQDYSGETADVEPLGSFLYYSSGTTGRPKGIVHRMPEGLSARDLGKISGRFHRKYWGFDERTVYLSTAPLYHAAPSGFCLATVALGGSVVNMQKFDAAASLEAIQRYNVTHAQFVPTMMTRMLKLDQSVRFGYDTSSLKLVLHSAAPCPEEIKRQMIDWLGPIVTEYYGGTESNGATQISSGEWLQHPGSVGRPISGTIHICDEAGAELPPGQQGLVYFEQPALPFEYFGDEQKTRDAQHPEHATWSCIGDMGHIDSDGYLYLTDRSSFMIVSGGVNIYPQEIEDALILHDKVLDVAVFGVPNKEMGEEVKAVIQLVDPGQESEWLAAELIEFARSRIAHFKCPRSVDFIEELPRLPTGKLYKRILKDRYWGNKQSRIV